ncbi:MAG: hypothetical protein ACRDYZ_00780 [Acidimicrobiales bacterium]
MRTRILAFVVNAVCRPLVIALDVAAEVIDSAAAYVDPDEGDAVTTYREDVIEP